MKEQTINIQPTKRVLAGAICSLLSAATLAAPEPDIEEVVVTATYQKSLEEAMEMKRQSVKVADAISAKDLGSFPSENIAEAIQRIPGVQISNVNGRGAQISVRGLGPQYSATTLNGQAFKSANFTNGFRFDIIQTELASSIEVIKSPSADMDAGGLSGTININTAKPLDFDETKLLITAKGQKSELSPTGDITPKLNATYVDQFVDGTVGIALNAGIQELDDRVDNFWVARWLEDDDGNQYARRARFRRIDRETDRKMLNGTVQWQPNDELDMSLTGVYASDLIDQDLNQQVFLLKRDYSTIDYDNLQNGYYRTVNVSNSLLENNRQLEERDLKSSAITADINWTRDAWTVSGVIHHTAGQAKEREEAAILGVIIPELTLDISDRDNVVFTTGNTDLASADLYTYTDDHTLSRNEYPNGAHRLMESSETAAQADVGYEFTDKVITGVYGGIKLRSESFDRDIKRRDRFVYGEADPANLPSMAEYNFMVTDFADGEMSIPGSWIAPDIQAYKDFLEAEGFDVPLRQIYQDSYAIDRDIFATYVKADFSVDLAGMLLRGDVGLRYESTERTLTSNLTGPTPDYDEEARTLIGTQKDTFSYSNVLPSLNTVLEINDEVQLRFAAAKVLVRPIITSRTSLAPTEDTSVEGGQTIYSVNLGQPNLEAMTANQLDFGVEWYYSEGAGLTFNAFYKSVKNGSVTETVCPGNYNGVALTSGSGSDCLDGDGNSYIITSTVNADDTTNITGYELGINQSFNGLLPLDGFGITANYTNISADNDEDGFRLADLSEETWNLTGYWENESFSVRASLNHRSPYYQPDSAASFFSREGRTVDGRDQIDITASWNINEQFKATFGALNLLGKNEEAFRDSDDVFQTLTTLGTNYYLGITYQL